MTNHYVPTKHELRSLDLMENNVDDHPCFGCVNLIDEQCGRMLDPVNIEHCFDDGN